MLHQFGSQVTRLRNVWTRFLLCQDITTSSDVWPLWILCTPREERRTNYTVPGMLCIRHAQSMMRMRSRFIFRFHYYCRITVTSPILVWSIVGVLQGIYATGHQKIINISSCILFVSLYYLHFGIIYDVMTYIIQTKAQNKGSIRKTSWIMPSISGHSIVNIFHFNYRNES